MKIKLVAIIDIGREEDVSGIGLALEEFGRVEEIKVTKVKGKETNSVRTYGRWIGNPKGTPEDITHCIESVPEGGRSVLFHQCYKKRGYGKDGLYCKQHAKKHPEEEK